MLHVTSAHQENNWWQTGHNRAQVIDTRVYTENNSAEVCNRSGPSTESIPRFQFPIACLGLALLHRENRRASHSYGSNNFMFVQTRLTICILGHHIHFFNSNHAFVQIHSHLKICSLGHHCRELLPASFDYGTTQDILPSTGLIICPWL